MMFRFLGLTACFVLVAGWPFAYDSKRHRVLLSREVPNVAREQTEPMLYKVARKFYPSRKKEPLFVVISLSSSCCERDQMTRLAAQLNKDFSEEPRLLVEIMDSAAIAEHVARAGDSYRLYMSAKRGQYHLDREKGLEYVQFSHKRGRPWNEVTLNFGRARPRLKDGRKARRLANGRACGDDHSQDLYFRASAGILLGKSALSSII